MQLHCAGHTRDAPARMRPSPPVVTSAWPAVGEPAHGTEPGSFALRTLLAVRAAHVVMPPAMQHVMISTLLAGLLAGCSASPRSAAARAVAGEPTLAHDKGTGENAPALTRGKSEEKRLTPGAGTNGTDGQVGPVGRRGRVRRGTKGTGTMVGKGVLLCLRNTSRAPAPVPSHPSRFAHVRPIRPIRPTSHTSHSSHKSHLPFVPQVPQ